MLDYRALPVPLLAVLCCGLRETSRICLRLQREQDAPPGKRKSGGDIAAFDTAAEWEAARAEILAGEG